MIPYVGAIINTSDSAGNRVAGIVTAVPPGGEDTRDGPVSPVSVVLFPVGSPGVARNFCVLYDTQNDTAGTRGDLFWPPETQ